MHTDQIYKKFEVLELYYLAWYNRVEEWLYFKGYFRVFHVL